MLFSSCFVGPGGAKSGQNPFCPQINLPVRLPRGRQPKPAPAWGRAAFGILTCVRQGCTGGSRRLRFVLPRYYYRPFQACCQGVFQSSRQREASPPGSNTETGFLYTPLLEIQKCTSIEKTQCLCGFPLLSGCTSIPHSCTLSSILVHLYNNENPSVYAGLRCCCTLSHLKPSVLGLSKSRLGAAS